MLSSSFSLSDVTFNFLLLWGWRTGACCCIGDFCWHCSCGDQYLWRYWLWFSSLDWLLSWPEHPLYLASNVSFHAGSHPLAFGNCHADAETHVCHDPSYLPSTFKQCQFFILICQTKQRTWLHIENFLYPSGGIRSVGDLEWNLEYNNGPREVCVFWCDIFSLTLSSAISLQSSKKHKNEFQHKHHSQNKCANFHKKLTLLYGVMCLATFWHTQSGAYKSAPLGAWDGCT